MNRKIYLIVSRGVLGIVISYILFFFAYKFIALGRLETIDGNTNFDVTAVLNISKDRITAESETYNRGVFIQYDCIIDSMYYVTIVRVGKMTNIELPNGLYFQDKPFQSREGWFNYSLASAAIFRMPYIAAYNVFLLPLKEVDKINIFVEGEIISKEYINDMTISCFVEANRTTFSFNNINKGDLGFIYRQVVNPTPVNIFFTIDADRNLYIGCASTGTGTPKTLSEILNEVNPRSDEAVK